MERNNNKRLKLAMKLSGNVAGGSKDRVIGSILWESIILFFGLTLSAGTATPIDSIGDFHPSPVTSTYGTVRQVQFSTDQIDLKADTLVQSPEGAVKHFRFAEPVWVIGFKTEIFDTDGKPSRENYLCHTFISNQTPDERPLEHSAHGRQMAAIYSDAFTQEVRLPDGFGLFIEPDEGLNWAPLFNNRQNSPVKVRMSVTVTLIRGKDVTKPLRRLYSTLRSVKVPHLFFVPTGRHQRQSTFEFLFDGKIYFMGPHVHPYAQSVELFNVSRREQVWKGTGRYNAAGEMVGMDVYSNPEGYPVHFGETYRIASVYDNPTDHEIDAMAGLFIFYSLDE
jgi:hypothetical protein